MKLYSLILDRSSSMSSIWNEITSAVNNHLETKSTDKLCSLLLFDTEGLDFLFKYEANVTRLDSSNFGPRGGTPLRDGIMYGIETLVQDWGDYLWQEGVEVEFVIFTDGEENSSTHWSSEDVARSITHLQDAHGWTFKFIGAGETSDVANYAKQFGIKTENAIGYTSKEQLEKVFAEV